MSSQDAEIRILSGLIFKKIYEYSIKSDTYRQLGKNELVFLQNIQHQKILVMYSVVTLHLTCIIHYLLRFPSDMTGVIQYLQIMIKW